MVNKTLIPWVKNPDGSQGYTWNPITGCLNHTPEGLCLGGNFPCYAYRLANGRLKSRYLANHNIMPHIQGSVEEWEKAKDPFYPRFWEDRLRDRGLFQSRPRGIFVCDMSDLFGIGVPEEWTDRVMDQIKAHRQHRFYLLTKQPQNLPKSPSYFPDNCWVGVTATSHQMFVEACLLLRDVKASIKYISIEPLLSWGAYPADKTTIKQWAKGLTLYGINQVIIGAQTKPYKPPKIEWVKEIVEACDKASIPVFLKDNLKPLIRTEGLPYVFWKRAGGLRQELPTTNV